MMHSIPRHRVLRTTPENGRKRSIDSTSMLDCCKSTVYFKGPRSECNTCPLLSRCSSTSYSHWSYLHHWITSTFHSRPLLNQFLSTIMAVIPELNEPNNSNSPLDQVNAADSQFKRSRAPGTEKRCESAFCDCRSGIGPTDWNGTNNLRHWMHYVLFGYDSGDHD